ncbi:MAG: ribosome silencing factor [Bacilli bacterium]|nr:ribosome silencing factor [Bacilli bacterium]
MRKDKTVKLVEQVLNEHKAEDIVTIDVSEKTPFADFYVLATAGNIRQLNALKELVEEALEKNKMSINHIEGTPESGWILIDAHHVIVNIFSKAERERISLEEVMSRK